MSATTRNEEIDGVTIAVPEVALVVLVGTTGAGKSTFAARHFRPTEVVSSDRCRAMVADDENDQSATPAAFELLSFIAGKRLEARRLTVVDATSTKAADRKGLIELARAHHTLAVAIVLDVPESVCAERNAARPDRAHGDHVVAKQHNQLRRSLKGLRREGFHRVFVLNGVDEIEAATVERTRLWNDRRDDHGPFDLIGDVHGCIDELATLLGELGYDVAPDRTGAHHPDGRRALFVGDLVDRGPSSAGVLRLAMGMVGAGDAVCIPGNHEAKLLRALRDRSVKVSHGLAGTLAELDAEPPEWRAEVAEFIDGLVSHLVLDDGRLVVAHAGLPEAMHLRTSAAVRSFALHGDTTGETDEFGLPVRYPWAEDYRGDASVVYGHTPVPEATWLNRTICVDTGCVFGGKLTALRYPERELVSVPAARTYWEPIRPIAPPGAEAARDGAELRYDDVGGKRIVTTRLRSTVTVEAEHSAAALEVMSRYAADPRWLVYLPPTMAPVATSRRDGLLEHPAEAFAQFRRDGVERVVCEEKHMGSRVVAVVCRDAEVAARRFGITADEAGADGAGIVHTRTGRRFFDDLSMEAALLGRLRAAVTSAGLWDELDTDWLVLDGELLPWSAKADELVRDQYAPVGAAANAMLGAQRAVLDAAAARGVDVAALAAGTADRAHMAAGFTEAYRRYCWPVRSVDDLRYAPFQVLAGEGRVHALADHRWHLDVLGRLAAADPGVLRATASVEVTPGDEAGEAAATVWWEELTAAGGEGMVVKPTGVIHDGPKGRAQPGLKVRGAEYLRIVYGPEYTAPDNLERLRSRRLGPKRSLALRELALGIEALERFVAGEPLHRVHECVFAVLALESEPVDPRL
ncbi:MAG: polynucleotide kinase-phosphatase [Actinomycetota bacterium]|nr:polynucleotide kinase-phosphatase [Actinomycetota bacterium]